MPLLPLNRLKVYREFKALDPDDHYGIIRYYEQHEENIQTFELEEYLDCALAYSDSLFETADYGKHIVMCDHLLELVIMENVESWSGEDLYLSVLFKKAASLYRNRDFTKAEHVVREMVKISPGNAFFVRFLRTCAIHRKPAWLMRWRVFALLCFLLAALVISVEFFVIRHFYTDYYKISIWLHNGLLGLGATALIASELYRRWCCYREVASFVQSVRSAKKTA